MSAQPRKEPKHVPHINITEIHNHKKIASALHAFNSIVLDEKLRWYSEELSRGYFSTPAEYASYMKIVHNKPMDFTTIKKKIYKHRYNDSNTLFSDMELVFKNAMAFNTKGDTWYDEAHRLHKLVLLLKNKKVIKLDKTPWFYNDPLGRLCPQCNNILLPSKTIQPRRCGDCSSNIRGERMDCFICHNHTDSTHSFCSKCVKKWCTICEHWHVGNKCKKAHTKKNKKTNTNNKNRKANNHSNNGHAPEWGVTKISLQVPAKPHGIAAVDKFERIIMKKNDTLKARIETIIKQIKSHDIESHFFKEVQIDGYSATVTNPIHFGEILQRMNGNKYATMGHILRDIKLLWSNCYKFNGNPDPNKGPTLFSNFAYDLQWAMQEYIKQFEHNLIKQGWIDANVSKSTAAKEEKHRKKHKHSKKSKHRKNDDNNRIAPLNKINKFENKSKSKTKKKNKKSVLIPKKRRNNASMLPTKKKKQLKHNESATTDTKSTKKHIKSNKNIINNKPEHTAVIAPNASTTFNNNASNVINVINNKNNKKIINDDDSDSSVFSINNDLVSDSKAVDVAVLLEKNKQFFEMPSTDTTQSTISDNSKSKKKRNRASNDYFSSNSDDQMDNFDMNHSRKKAKLSASPAIDIVSVSSTEKNNNIVIPAKVMNINNQIIPQKRPSQFGFTTAVNIKAPPRKKRKINTEQSVYGIPTGINTIHNINNTPPNLMTALSVNGTHSVYPYPQSQHQNIYNHHHSLPLHHNNTIYSHSHHSSSINDTETQSLKITPHQSPPMSNTHRPHPLPHTHTHSTIHSSPTMTAVSQYNPSLDSYGLPPNHAIQHSTYSMLPHPTHNMLQPFTAQTSYNAPPNTQRIFLQPQHNAYPIPTHPPHTRTPIRSKKRNKQTLKRTPAANAAVPTVANVPGTPQQPPPPQYIENSLEYYLGMAEHCLRQQTTPHTVPYTVAGSLQPNNNTFNKSTVTTSTSSSINSQPQRIATISSSSHSNEYPDNMLNESSLCQKIIKGIYSKAISIDMQDNLHPAKRFETIDKFPQPHGMEPIAIFDIHQKIANNNTLWQAYYDFAYIWTMQIHHNTDAADTAKKFNKYVDDVFNNVLNDAQTFASIKHKALDKLQQLFAVNPINMDVRIHGQQLQHNDKHSVTDAFTVATVGYKRASGLFSDMPKKAPNLKRILSDDSDKPILAHINSPPPQPQLPLQTVFYSGDVSVSPSVKSSSNSNSGMHCDQISVASNISKVSSVSSVSHVSRASNAANNNVNNHTHTCSVTTPVSTSASTVVSMSSNPPKNKRKIVKKRADGNKLKIAKRDPPKPKAPVKHKKSKKKKSKKKHKSKKHKVKHKKKKAFRLKTKPKPSTLKKPSTLRTKPAVKPVAKPVVQLVVKPMIKPQNNVIKPTKISHTKTAPTIKKQNTSPMPTISAPTPSPSPPAILLNKMQDQEMSDTESINSAMLDASPFLKPQPHVSFMDHVPSPPPFSFDDNCSVNTSTTTLSTLTTMSMAFNGRNPAALCKPKLVKHNNPFNKDDFKDTEANDMEENKPFTLFKIPKIAKKSTPAVVNESLKITADSDDDDDDLVKKQIQDAHKREIAERVRRQKELQLKKEKEKQEKAKQDQLRKQKEKIKQQQQLLVQQKQKQMEKIKKTKPNTKNKRFTLKLKRTSSHSTASKGAPLKAVSSILVVPTATAQIKVVRPVIPRGPNFGDHLLKAKRALTVYREFKRSATGKLFENENVLNGRFGIHLSELLKHNTYSNRLIPYAIDKQQFINLPLDLQTFCHKLFDFCALSNNNNSNMLSIKFAKYYFNLLYKCFAQRCDYQQRQDLGAVSADFAGAKWIRIIYEFKEECIKADKITLFKPFDPSIRPEQDAVIACAAVNLWRQANPITFFEIELKLQYLLYTTNASIKQDIQSAFDNLQDIFLQNESYRTFIETLRRKWVEYRTTTKFNAECDNDTLLANYSVFETSKHCIEHFAEQKSKEQRLLGKELKIESILEDWIIKTRLDGDINFFYVKYVDFAEHIVWEPRVYLLRYYREETKHYIRNKKVSHPNGGILLTVPNQLTAHKAFMNGKAGYVPRDREQFAPRREISLQLRQEINRIAAKKAAAIRKRAKQANKMRISTQSDQQKEIKKEIEASGGSNINVWKQLIPSSPSCNDSNILNGDPISFSFATKNDTDIDIDIDIDGAMSMSMSMSMEGSIVIANVAESPDKSQSIFSQNNVSTPSVSASVSGSGSGSGISNNEIANMSMNSMNMNSMDIDIGDVQPLVLSLSMQTNGSNDDDDEATHNKVTTHIPAPPPMPMPIFG